MTQYRSRLAALLVAAAATTSASVVHAAELVQVNGWASGMVPNDVSMSIYVPDNVVDNPPVLALIHYCGGDAPAVFGQARGGGVVAAADEYGFIMVVPSSGRCWDVVSDTAHTRDSGGDSHAIKQMVEHAIANYDGNPDRVYATGDSSGGMMTELLLGLYPEIFKAGSAMAGMPAGCRGNNEGGNGSGYSGACAGGGVTRTPEEWGDIVRGMNPGYMGHLPRVQMFHGDMDTTIRVANHHEAIKQWTNLHGLSQEPTITDQGVRVGTHDATRLRWQNACGATVVDALESAGGDHGPSDALFLAEFVIPFLGLDQTGPIDPEVEMCGEASGGTGGAGGTGGEATGGTAGVGQGGSGGNPVGGAGAGGLGGNGGTAVGGFGGGGFGGETSGQGGMAGVGGVNVGGTAPMGGVGGTVAITGMGGSGVAPPSSGSPDSGACVCRLDAGRTPSRTPAGLLALGLGWVGLLRRRRKPGAGAERLSRPNAPA